jgi:sterol desaturase/sphingolipid hydroxylase (fatty acid hydroxylase superfamily)
MLADFPALLATKLIDVMSSLLPSALAMAAVCTALCLFSSQACNPGKVWWRNRGLVTDLWYWLIIPFLAPYLRMGLLIGLAAFAMAFTTADELNSYIVNGHGPLGALPFWWQAAAYLLLSDFLLYWIHRLFHGAQLWRYHAIHHSAQDVDWTTAYRFHPVNLWFGPFLVDVMMLYAGASPTVLLLLAPFQTAMAIFVHANLNWTLGPLKYVVATPVFHRWHHTAPSEGGNLNFAPTFAIWDVIFNTFYMPAGALPQTYGVDDPAFPQNFLQQLIYPFRSRDADSNRPVSAPPAAIGSVRPRP